MAGMLNAPWSVPDTLEGHEKPGSTRGRIGRGHPASEMQSLQTRLDSFSPFPPMDDGTNGDE